MMLGYEEILTSAMTFILVELTSKTIMAMETTK